MSIESRPIVVEQIFSEPASSVWKAITVHPEMIKWFFENIPDFEAKVGFRTQFMVKTPDRSFLHQWKIIEVIPEEKIVYDWSYEEYPGRGVVTFVLSEHERGTLLKVISEGMHTFPQEIPEFKRDSCEGGWEYFIQGRLKEYFEKQ